MFKTLLLLAALSGSSAFASTEVVFFGGYGATAAQMNCWRQGAEAQPAYAGYSFQAYPYPAGATSSQASAQKYGAATIDAVVAEIDGNPGVHFVIAGHSSGAALSNRVAELVKRPGQIELINLDGFAPPMAVQRSVDSHCIYAESTKINGLESLNAASMKGNCLISHAYSDAHCTTAWCMHFSLVNEAAPANLSSSTFKVHGYDGCKTNLSWLASARLF